MVTELRAHGLRVVIFVNDHPPAHVHVIGDGEAKINLLGAIGTPELVWADGMNRGDLRRAVHLVTEQQAFLLARWRRSMAEFSDTDIDAARERGRIARAIEPRAESARYDQPAGRLVVELTNGCVFAFPPRLAQGLENATDDQLAHVEILDAGCGLHWEELDADLSVPGLLAGLFGTKAYMAQLAGRSTSPAKVAAARANGTKGGRPRRSIPPN